ncbi:hypothetical protein ACLOJK_012804 [Asimina triloba]
MASEIQQRQHTSLSPTTNNEYYIDYTAATCIFDFYKREEGELQKGKQRRESIWGQQGFGRWGWGHLAMREKEEQRQDMGS